MNIEHWIILYLFVNGVLCYLGGVDGYEDPFTLESIGMAMLGAAFAIPIVIVVLCLDVAEVISKWLDGLFQFRTYWRYVFARKRLVVEDHDVITSLWQWGLKHRASNSLRDRLWRHAERIIHKANNYTPPTNTTEG